MQYPSSFTRRRERIGWIVVVFGGDASHRLGALFLGVIITVVGILALWIPQRSGCRLSRIIINRIVVIIIIVIVVVIVIIPAGIRGGVYKEVVGSIRNEWFVVVLVVIVVLYSSLVIVFQIVRSSGVIIPTEFVPAFPPFFVLVAVFVGLLIIVIVVIIIIVRTIIIGIIIAYI